MSRLTDLLARAKAENKELGEELEQEFKMLANRRAFGLAFEHHQPETIELWGRSRPIEKIGALEKPKFLCPASTQVSLKQYQ